MVQVKEEEGLRGVNLDDEVIDANPCAVFYDNCRSAAVRRAIGPTRSSTTGWSEEEDYLLRQAVESFRGRNWKKIAERLPGRTANQCFSRWKRVLDPEIFKGTWTKEEDDCIRESVEKYGRRKWSVIARSLPGRLGKQCRERWYNHLDPAIKKTVWTEDEDQILTRYHEIYGNKWSKIARFLDGRSDNTIKNRWNWLVKKKFDSYLPCTSGMDWQIVDSSNIYSCETKPDCMELVEGRHSVKVAESHFEKAGLKNSGEKTSSHLAPDMTNEFLNKEAKYRLAGMRGSLGGVDELTHVTIPDDRGPDSSVASVVFEITDKEANISRSPLVACDLELSLFVPDSTGSSCKPLLDIIPAIMESSESPVMVRGYGSAFIDPRFDSKMEMAGSSTSTSHSSENKIQADNMPCKMHTQDEVRDHNSLQYESPKTKDLITGVYNHVMQSNSPSYCVSPLTLKQGISVNCDSPESTLRNLARTFKNTPSIIRKRVCRETGIATSSDITWTPSSKISCMNAREAANGKRILHVEQDFLVFSISQDLHLWFDMCEKDTGPLTRHLKE